MTAIYSLIILGFIGLIDMMFILFPESLKSLFGFKKRILHPTVKQISFSILPQKGLSCLRMIFWTRSKD